MSKTIKTNNCANALKQAKAYEKKNGVAEGNLSDKLKEEILVGDKNHYHVLLVKKRHDTANQRYLVAGNVQTFGRGLPFEKIKKNFATQGFATLIILHDPTQNKDDDSDSRLKGFEKSAIERQIEKEERDAMNKRIAERKAEAIEKAKAEKQKQAETVGSQQSKKDSPLIFEGLEITVDNIDQFAKDNKVDLSPAKTDEGKLAIVKNWIDKELSK